MSQRIKWVKDQTLDEEVIEERILEIQVKAKGEKKNQEMMKMIGRQKKEMVIPQELQI